MKMKICLLSILFLTIIATSCNKSNKPDDFDYGKVENGKYINSYFNIEMTLPKDWIVQNKEQMENNVKAGGKVISGDDSKMKAVLKASEINTANLLAINQYEIGAPVDFNPSIMLIAENVKNSPGIKSGKEYLFQSRKILAQAQFKYDHMDSVFSKEEVNGTEFYLMNANVNYMDINIQQMYYSTIIKGFSFNVILSFATDEQKNELMKSLNSMTFKN